MTTAHALIVEPGLTDVLMFVPVLSALGFQVTATENFQEAKQSLSVPPRLLVTDIRLGEFNGLHLVLRGRSARHDMAAIVTSDIDDPVLRADAEAMGATFVVRPVSPDDLRAAVARTVLRDFGSQPAPIRAPFERRKAARRTGMPAVVVAPDRRTGDRRAEVRVRLFAMNVN